MRWAVGAVLVALVAAVAVNVLLLGYGADRHDPVGRLSPVADLRTPPPPQHAAPTLTVDD
jgi:hypothetical protein